MQNFRRQKGDQVTIYIFKKPGDRQRQQKNELNCWFTSRHFADFWHDWLAWISSDYFESLILPQLLRGENDSKQSDDIQANDWLYINRFYEKKKWNLGRIFFFIQSLTNSHRVWAACNTGTLDAVSGKTSYQSTGIRAHTHTVGARGFPTKLNVALWKTWLQKKSRLFLLFYPLFLQALATMWFHSQMWISTTGCSARPRIL